MNEIELACDEVRVYFQCWTVNCQNKQLKNTRDSRQQFISELFFSVMSVTRFTIPILVFVKSENSG